MGTREAKDGAGRRPAPADRGPDGGPDCGPSAGSPSSARAGRAPAPGLWEHLDRPAPAKTGLSHARIAEAAMALADAEGLGAVSMRRIAGGLGVAPMALYRHVSGKDDVYELMVDAVYAAIPPAADTGTWREVMRADAASTRAAMLRHPWMVEIAFQPIAALTPNRLAAAERALTSLDGLGLDVDSMMAVISAVSAYVQGAVGSEVAQRQLMLDQGWSSGDDMREALRPRMQWLMGTSRYPVWRRYAFEAVQKDNALWRFEFGLECVLDGIGTRLGI